MLIHIICVYRYIYICTCIIGIYMHTFIHVFVLIGSVYVYTYVCVCVHTAGRPRTIGLSAWAVRTSFWRYETIMVHSDQWP